MNQPAFPLDVFLSHSSKDKAVVWPLAERLRKDGLKVWFDEWEIAKAEDTKRTSQSELQPSALSLQPLIEHGLEHSRVLPLAHRMGEGAQRAGEGCMSAQAFGSDWAQLEAGTCGRGNLPFRDPLNHERRFIPLRLDDAPIKGCPGAIPLHQLAPGGPRAEICEWLETQISS